jgi:acetoin utilization deacetylase AcuC-like enzyme
MTLKPLRKTAYNFQELYLWHDNRGGAGTFPPGLTVQPGEHYESPETKRRLNNLLEVSGILDHVVRIKATAASMDQLELCHYREYVEKIQNLSKKQGGEAGIGVPFGVGSFDIAALAVGGVIAIAEAVWKQEVQNGYALVRPPGHHAVAHQGMGFCIFANLAITAKWLMKAHGVKRLAIVDWDVHHGNGTQELFYESDECLTISIHQNGLWPPESGKFRERGKGRGQGYNLNVPLPAGSGNGAYLEAFEKIVLPAIAVHRPEIILVACGFDASVNDPLGRMMVTSTGFRRMTQMLVESASKLCDGKLVFANEGGYSLSYVPYCGLAVIEELAGFRTSVIDPNLAKRDSIPGQTLESHQEQVINKIAQNIQLTK